jgi:hypothetical protein
VLVAVGVRRYHLARRKTPLYDRKRPAEAFCRYLVDYIQHRKVQAFIRTEEYLLVLLGCHGMFLLCG